MDIFVSYNKEDVEHAMSLVHFLEERKLNCWIAPRNVALSYASDIVDAISKCKIFLLIISKHTLGSVHVLNEIEQAYKYYTKGQLAIIPFFIESVTLNPAMDYYLARIQHIYATGNQEAATNQLLEKIEQAYKQLGVTNIVKEEISNVVKQINDADEIRLANRYYDVDDKYEKRRLMAENELLYRFEKEVMDELLEGQEHLNGLITTCMHAPSQMAKINLNKFDKIIGLCYNEKAVFEANYDFKNDHCKFFEQDVEDDDFEEKMESYMEEMNVDKFDFVDITMGFLDWKNPFKVIKTLKKFMRTGCRVFVRDVDDGVVMYYPDDSKMFAKFKSFYALDPISGFRKSGRRVFSYFKKLHAQHIDLVHSGIDVTDMTIDEKEKMFFSWFGFIPNDFKICFNEDPSRDDFKGVIEWCHENYDSLEETFMGDSFFFNSGYFIYKIIM